MLKRILFFHFFLLSIYCNAQNTLDKAKKSVKSNKTEQSSSSSSKSKTSNNSSYSLFDDEDTSLQEFFGQLILVMTYETFKAIFIASPWEGAHINSKITKHPYYQSKKGDFNYLDNDNFKLNRFLISNDYFKSNRRIQGNYFKTEFQFAKRLSLETDFLYLSENDFLRSKTNYLHYSLLLNYYRVRTEKFSLWYGLGLRYAGSGINDSGLAYSFGFRSFIAKPFSIETSFKGSRINQSNINHFNSQFKYHRKNKVFSIGYTHFKFGSENFDGISAGLGIFL